MIVGLEIEIALFGRMNVRILVAGIVKVQVVFVGFFVCGRDEIGV